MKPDTDRDLLQAYLDGELPSDREACVVDRLRREPALADALLMLAQEDAIITEWAQATVVAGEHLPMAGISRRELLRAGSPVVQRVRWAMAGSMLAAGLAASLFIVFTSSLFQTTIKPFEDFAVASLEDVQGDVFVVAGNKETAAHTGQSLLNGERLRTEGEGSSAVVAYADRAKLEVGPDTTVRLTAQQSGQGRTVLLEQGVVAANVPDHLEDSPMTVLTSHAETRVLDGARANFSSMPEETRIEQERGNIKVTRRSDGQTIAVPTGGFFVSANADGVAVRPLPPLKSQPRLVLTDVSSAVLSGTFSPDGNTLAVGCADGAVRSWNPANGNLRLAFNSNGKKGVKALGFSADGSLLATANDGKTVRAFDPATGKELDGFRGYKGRASCLSFSSDGNLLATSGVPGKEICEIKLWNPKTREEIATLPGHTGAVLALAFSSDSKLLASAGRDNVVNIWDVATRTIRRTFTGHTLPVYCLAFSPDGELLATGGKDSTVKLWDLVTGKEIRTLRGHTSAVRSLAFSPNGRLLATGDTNVRIWDLAMDEERFIFRGQRHGISTVAFSPDGKTLISAGWDMTVRLWDLMGEDNVD